MITLEPFAISLGLFPPRLRRILKEITQDGQKRFSTDDLLLALLKEEDCQAILTLRDMGVTEEKLREALKAK